MRSADKKGKKVSIITAIVIIIVVVRVLSGFPVIRFNDKRILVFSLDRMVAMTPNFDIIRPMGSFTGTVIGNHVLETEHGEITLKHSASISSQFNTVFRIDVENFRVGLATHSLVIEGIEIPQNISLSFNMHSFNMRKQIGFLTLHNQEVMVTDIPLVVRNIDLYPPREIADIVIDFLPPDYIVLSDTTKIHFIPSPHGGHRFLRGLYIYKGNERWVIRGRTDVRLPGETEFVEYREITFRPHWGEFIRGELWEQ